MQKVLAENVILSMLSGITVLMVFAFAHFFILRSKKLHKENDGLHHAFEKNETKLHKALKERAVMVLALESIGQGIIITDEDEKVIFINKTAEKYLEIKDFLSIVIKIM